MDRRKQNTNHFLLLLLACAVSWISCSDHATSLPQPIENDLNNGDIPTLFNAAAIANNQFGFDLFSRNKEGNENIAFSPYSISTVLTIAAEGARGTTEQEMRTVLHLPHDQQTTRTGFLAIYNEFNTPDSTCILTTANALWLQKEYPFIDTFSNNAANYYQCTTTNLDFIQTPESSRVIINTWVEEKTQSLIKDFLPQGSITPITRIVISNTVYFKAYWRFPFDSSNTTMDDFSTQSDGTVPAKTMHQKSYFYYGETEAMQMVELPYKGKGISMYVLLPRTGQMNDVEKALSADKILQWGSGLESKLVDFSLPKFKFEAEFDLTKTLTNMGMPTAFTTSADFSGMTDYENLHIGFILHKVVINVNESGTEAAAATAMGMTGASQGKPLEPIIFKADHPFIFVIQQKSTGTVLFIGKVNNPKR
jgi:serpin B